MRYSKWFVLLAIGAGLILSNPVAYAQEHPADHDEFPEAAPGSTQEDETCFDWLECGDMLPLVPISYNAVGAGIVWTKDDWNTPKIQYKGRHSEFRQKDVYSEDCIEKLILNSGYSAWPIPREEWDTQYPPNNPNGPTAAPAAAGAVQTYAEWNNPATAYNVFFDAQRVNRQDPKGVLFGTKSFSPCMRSSFKWLVYGGYNIHQGQSLFVADRIRAHWDIDNSQLWDLGHPDAQKNRGIFDNARIDEGDVLMNIASFKNAGQTRGLNYNIYSLGYATLTDGRVVNIGGHNMQSNNGFRKLNIYDPEKNRWEDRPVPCQVKNWRKDPGGVNLGYQTFADNAAGGQGLGERLANAPEGAPTWSDCNQRIRDHVDPPHRSDLRYGRWYPSGVTMPDGRVLIYGGDDLDESVGPDRTLNQLNQNGAFPNTQIIVPVPEIYDPKTDRTIALENARKIYPLYPQSVPVQTGPGKNDWAICILTGESAPAAEATVPRSDAIDEAAEWRNFCDTAGCAEDTRAIRLQGQRPQSSMDCLNVLAAEADPARNIPAENHYTHVDTTEFRYPYCCGFANILKIGPDGKTKNHFYIQVAGQGVPAANQAAGAKPAIEMIDFAEPNPQFKRMVDLWQPVGQGPYATGLADGTVQISHGAGPGGQGYENTHNTKYQIFDPWNNTIKTMAKTTFASSNFHCTVMLLPTAETINMGCDRANLNPTGNRMFPPGDQDLGVSVSQVYRPPYLFAEGDEGHDEGMPMGHRPDAVRPVIKHAPKYIEYKEKFDLDVELEGDTEVKMVTMVRTGFVTHTLTMDNRTVIPHFEVKDSKGKGHGGKKWKSHKGKWSNDETRKVTVRVHSPRLPVQAIAGDYMVFVINDEGTPSVAKRVRLLLDDDKGRKHDDRSDDRSDDRGGH
jgi:hypothetical protein